LFRYIGELEKERNMQKRCPRQIALIITSDGIKGYCLIGNTAKDKEESLKFYNLLEPDLIQVKDLLNTRIKLLLHKSNKTI
jgi:hypothetical protein